MAREEKKDFNAMLREDRGMPRVQRVEDERTIARYGGSRMLFAPPLAYDKAMRQVPWGRVTTAGEIRAFLAAENGADFTEPLTAGAFISIAAWASYQRQEDETPYWRTLKAGGELNPKYPGGIEAQRQRLEAEGHAIAERGRKVKRYFVENYEAALWSWLREEKDS